MKRILGGLVILLLVFSLVSCSNKIEKTVVTTDVEIYKAVNTENKQKIVINNTSVRTYNVFIYFNDEKVAKYNLITNSGYQYIIKETGVYSIKCEAISRGTKYVCNTTLEFD